MTVTRLSHPPLLFIPVSSSHIFIHSQSLLRPSVPSACSRAPRSSEARTLLPCRPTTRLRLLCRPSSLQIVLPHHGFFPLHYSPLCCCGCLSVSCILFCCSVSASCGVAHSVCHPSPCQSSSGALSFPTWPHLELLELSAALTGSVCLGVAVKSLDLSLGCFRYI